MVSAPERMFGHQLCKHLLTHKSCLGKHRKQRGQGSPDWRHYWVELMVISHQLQKICCLQRTNLWFTPFEMRGAALSEHHTQNLRFSAPISRCCATPALWSAIPGTLIQWSLIPGTGNRISPTFGSMCMTWQHWQYSCTSSKVQRCAGSEERDIKIKFPLTFFSHSSIFFLDFLLAEDFNIPETLISVVSFSCMNVN